MTDKIQNIQTMLNGLYNGGDVTEAARSSLQFVINEAKKEAINYTRCCTELNADYKNKHFINGYRQGYSDAMEDSNK